MNSMKYILFSLLVFSLLGGLFATIHNSEVTTVTYKRDTPSVTTEVVTQIAEPEEIVEEPVVSTANQVKEIEIQPGDTFSTIMEEVDVTAENKVHSGYSRRLRLHQTASWQTGHVVIAQDASVG